MAPGPELLFLCLMLRVYIIKKNIILYVYVRIRSYTGDRAVFQRCTSLRESSSVTLPLPLRLSSENKI